MRENRGMKKAFGLIGILLTVAIIATMIGGGFYFTKSGQRKSQIQIGREAVKQAEELKTQIESQNIPLDWKELDTIDWFVKYPPQFQMRKLVLQDQEHFLFKDNISGKIFSIYLKNVFTLPEYSLLRSIQQSNKLDVIEALLQVQKIGVEQQSKDERSTILIEKIFMVNGIKAAQFGVQEVDGSIILKTSFEKNGKIVDIVVFPKNLDLSDPLIQIYNKILISFTFKM